MHEMHHSSGSAMTVCDPGVSHDGGTTYTRRTSTSSSSGIPQFSQTRAVIRAFFPTALGAVQGFPTALGALQAGPPLPPGAGPSPLVAPAEAPVR